MLQGWGLMLQGWGFMLQGGLMLPRDRDHATEGGGVKLHNAIMGGGVMLQWGREGGGHAIMRGEIMLQ